MSKILEKHDTIFAFSGVVINLLIAYQSLVLWVNPDINSPDEIITLSIVLAFEFFMLPSGILMAMLPKKVSLYIIFPFIGLFALAMNALTNSNIILIIYSIAIINRLRFAFSDVSEEIKSDTIGKYFLAMISCFIIAPLITAIVIYIFQIPEFGLTQEFLNISGYYEQLESSNGISGNKPQYLLFAATIYYILLALIEYLYIRKPVTN